MTAKPKLTDREKYEKYDKLAKDKCRVDHRCIKQKGQFQVAPHGGSVVWVDDESVGIQCCDPDDTVILGIYPEDATECPVCGCKLYVEIDVKIMRVLE